MIKMHKTQAEAANTLIDRDKFIAELRGMKEPVNYNSEVDAIATNKHNATIDQVIKLAKEQKL